MKNIPTSVYIPKDMHARLSLLAVMNRRSLNQQILYLLEAQVGASEEQEADKAMLALNIRSGSSG